MDVVALDGTKLLALMVAGGTFALAGLWLMFRPQAEGDAARIEIFGLKFQASSAGVLVFLIGAVFLAVPIFVPEKPVADRAGLASSGPETAEGTPGSSNGHPAIILPRGADATEIEPNNTIHEANQIERGVFYSAAIEPRRGNPEDWFVVPTADIQNQDLSFQIRSRSAEMNQPYACQVEVLDDREIRLLKRNFADTGASIHGSVYVGQTPHFFFRISSFLQRWCRYELKVD